MRILTRHDVQNAVTMKEAIEAAGRVFASSSAGKADIPLRTQIDIEKNQGVMLYMPGYLKDLDALGVKAVSVFTNNASKGLATVQSVVMLQDSKTGSSLALMDGVFLTALRTGAASGAATRALAKIDASTVAVFGAGQQARTQLEAIACVRTIQQVWVYDPNGDAVVQFINHMKDKLPVEVKMSPAESPAQAVAEADIVITATVSSTPVFPGKALKKGVHINGIGSYKPTMREMDVVALQRADKVFVDNRHAALEEAGDLVIPINEGLITDARVTGEIGQVLNGELPGRERDDEITIFKTVGFAALDMIVAQLVYEKALAQGFGSEIDLSK